MIKLIIQIFGAYILLVGVAELFVEYPLDRTQAIFVGTLFVFILFGFTTAFQAIKEGAKKFMETKVR